MSPVDSRRTKADPRLGVTRQLWFWVLVAIVAATILGLVAPTLAKNLQPLGTVFITAIKMIVGPIVFSLVVTGIGGVSNLKEAGRIGLRSIIYFEIVTTVAIVLGLVAVNVFKPGAGLDIDPASIDMSEDLAGYIGQGEHKNWWDFLLGIVPKSMVSPFVDGNILQILFIAILVAIAIQLVGAPARPLVSGLEKVNLVMFKVLKLVMYAAPIGVFGALTAMIGSYGLETLASLGRLIGLYWATCVLFIVCVLGAIMWAMGLNLFKLLRYIKEEILIVLGTSSSESVLPQILLKLEKLGAPREVVGLTVPTGYSFNQDGTSIYYSVCAVFIAQATGVELSIWAQIGLVLVLMLTSKGVAAVTGAGFIVLAATLSVIGSIPVAGIMLIFGINRFLSDGAAITNLCGNTVAGLVISKWEGVLDVDRTKRVLDRKFVEPLTDNSELDTRARV
ncbi:aerobic C4-dicarboxylate transport protein [Arthrobacter sp. V4I6]|uniref:C4-dicarboxylate transporter DctA n=1 Tax=unclassified Arthrobacter TaxID=235627 RepID=UPI002780EA2F|nr:MULTISPECIES: C4-dicarboxylate transporter DctA [unclassified Arthrobacter]MDQ0823662.1 aerobic C4-dicarboxylate transport protein [Arthrobacter sp. V1I7]MDQ0853296.1 aerobic C4-dicarboxylate transport protein [Arthrobacter sp. V4I6]